MSVVPVEFQLAHAITVAYDTAYWCLIGMIGIFLIDITIGRRFKARYFVCHTFVNGMISFLVIPDSWYILTDPLEALQQKSCTSIPLGLVFAIHLYHMLGSFVPLEYGGFKLYYVDWLHHILMVCLGCPASMFAGLGPLVNFNFLFICGIPGGLDYLMLTLVKEGKMKALDEKRINTTLNVWCRCPFLVSCVVLTVIQCHMHQPPTHVLLMRIFCMLINWWNGLYFMERVVSNYYVTQYRLKEALKQEGGDKMVDKMANRASLRSNKVLVDAPEDHPLPSAPMAPRVMKTKQAKSVWEFIRAGS